MKKREVKFVFLSGVVLMLVISFFMLMCSNTREESSVPALLSYDEFEAQAFVETFQGVPTGIIIVDGHTPIDGIPRMQLLYEEYVKAYQQAFGLSIVDSVNGVDIIWDSSRKLQLTYCISNSFGARKASVVQAMSDATLAWESSANVDFKYMPEEDINCSSKNGNVLFDVQLTTGQIYLARSFFPDSARYGRNIMINETSFNVYYPLTLTGILRHELGHVLGLRHEHTRPEAGKCFEDNQWRPLTAYDPASVMQYPQCSGTGDYSFILTIQDKIGISSLYGAPVK
jgi:hypothetical protein